MAFVEMKDVYKRYRTGEVVTAARDGINFTIEKGEFAIIVGPSGAGKTTVLNILRAAWTLPMKVRCWWTAATLYSTRPVSWSPTGGMTLGLCSSFYNLVQKSDGTGKMWNWRRRSAVIRCPAKEALEAVGLGHRLDNFPAQLSAASNSVSPLRAGTGEASQAAAVRRADRCFGLQYRETNSCAAAKCLP